MFPMIPTTGLRCAMQTTLSLAQDITRPMRQEKGRNHTKTLRKRAGMHHAALLLIAPTARYITEQNRSR
jgi:hypothetical protein